MIGICDMVIIKPKQSIDIYKHNPTAKNELEKYRDGAKKLVVVDIRFMHNLVAEMNNEIVNILVCDPDAPRHLQYERGIWVPGSFVEKVLI